MKLLEWIISPFTESANCDTFLKKEFIEMSFDFDTKSMSALKRIGYFWTKEKTVTKYTILYAIVVFILVAFPNSYMVKFTFGHEYHLLSKQKNNLK